MSLPRVSSWLRVCVHVRAVTLAALANSFFSCRATYQPSAPCALRPPPAPLVLVRVSPPTLVSFLRYNVCMYVRACVGVCGSKARIVST